MSFYHIRPREGAKYEAAIHCRVQFKFNWFTIGRIPTDEGVIMAELDEPGDEPNFHHSL